MAETHPTSDPTSPNISAEEEYSSRIASLGPLGSVELGNIDRQVAAMVDDAPDDQLLEILDRMIGDARAQRAEIERLRGVLRRANDDYRRQYCETERLRERVAELEGS